MFGNKKNNLPPRPHPPLAEQILEDILNAKKDDIVFSLAAKEPRDEVLHYPMNTNDTESVYNKLKTYLSVKESLTELRDILKGENVLLQQGDLEMKEMAEGIRKQAQEALTVKQ